MYLICNRCHRIIRSKNAVKHSEKCLHTTFSCCDCNSEFNIHTIETHTVCPNAIKTLAPAIYNPKAKINSPSLDSLRIIDRMAFEHANDEKKDLYNHLCEIESIPRKEKGFIDYIGTFCHISKEEATELWTEYSNWDKQLIEEKRMQRHDHKKMNKKIKAEAKRVESKERREKYFKEKSEKKEEPVKTVTNRYEKQVTKLMRLNLDNYKLKDSLKQAVIDIIKEKDESADVDLISEAFENKYPSLRG